MSSERLCSKKIKATSSEVPINNDSETDQEIDVDSAIFQLEMVHLELDKLNDKENEEILTIEQKYKKLRHHFFSKREEIVESIPDFWCTVFTSHPSICNILYGDDEDSLRYLQKLEVDISENIKSGYCIKLHFNENPYFKNELLVKEFIFKNGNLSSVSTRIDWKNTNCAAADRGSISKCSRKRPHISKQTFFGWFANNEDAASDNIAEIIKDDIWPNSLHYYLVPDSISEGNNHKGLDSTDSSSEYDDEIFADC